MSDRTTTDDGTTENELRAYYRERAGEYDRVYAKPERQADIARLASWLRDELAGARVLELAAGTGFWTERYAPVAASVRATDVNPETLAVAQARGAWSDRVTFDVADAYAPGRDVVAADGEPFDAVFAGFFWSHVPRADLARFLDGVVAAAPGARLVIVDNRYVEGSNHPITRRDDSGDTYQRRRLDDGTEWDVLKNFPDPAEVRAALAGVCTEVAVTELEYYWTATGRLVSSTAGAR
ncbi:MAG: class I SAM-dependent methyltransferase [Actinomycetota bacterium]|nr:class I SAM-dependent methyltransferase [Actinomycetota bacterium]